MKNISGSIISSLLLLVLTQPLAGQDTLRTYGPRIGIDLARFAYIFADPSEIGAELSVDAEVYKNIFPVFEIGYCYISETGDLFDYSAGGSYARAGVDYNLLSVTDRSVHHSITVGFRYGVSLFSHRVEDAFVPSAYWGDVIVDTYENNLTGNWFELVGGLMTEVTPNLFLGWSLRYKVLLNPEMDPFVTPLLVPGYGRGTADRGFGFTYSIFYKIPLFKR
ncbi:MAG: hypothetical protein KAR19_14185 [Bacteroidales bacterium]|nr:hypothetical protein [Bacteroidales bacterium]